MSRHNLLAFLCVSLAAVSTALAQNTSSAAPARGTLVSYGIAVLAVLSVIGLSIMSAKRTHQD